MRKLPEIVEKVSCPSDGCSGPCLKKDRKTARLKSVNSSSVSYRYERRDKDERNFAFRLSASRRSGAFERGVGEGIYRRERDGHSVVGSEKVAPFAATSTNWLLAYTPPCSAPSMGWPLLPDLRSLCVELHCCGVRV